MVRRHADFVDVQQITIVGVPGPDYFEVARTEVRPAPEAFGWYLTDEASDLWSDQQWDWYLYNWLRAGVPALRASAGHPEAEAADRLRWIAADLESFTHTYYDEPITVPSILFGVRYDPEADGYRVWLRKALLDLQQTGYRAYHGKIPNLAWLKDEYPRLVEKLVAVAALLPPRPAQPRTSPDQGVVIGALTFTDGVRFTAPEERRAFEEGEWDQLRAGTKTMAKKFFRREAEAAGTMRVLVHTGSCWSTWRSFGPLATDEVWAEVVRAQEKFPPQRRLAPRVYEGRGSRMNKIEIYDGRRLVREISTLG